MSNVIGVDIRDDRLEQAKDETGVDELTKDLGARLKNGGVDTIFVTLPTAFHTPVIAEGAAYGCNMVIEKPVSATSEGLADILKIVKEKKICTHVAYCYRFAPSVKRMKELVDANRLGKVLSARLHISTFLPDWHPWEDYRDFYMSKIEQGGGARLDESHGIDLLRWLFGEIDTVFASVEKVSELDISSDDLTIMLLKFKNGLTAEAHFDLLGRSPRIGLELIGSDGTLLWDRINGTIEIFDPKSKRWSVENFGSDDFVKSYDLQAEYLIKRFGENKSSECDLEDGIKTLRVLEAALESSLGGTTINI